MEPSGINAAAFNTGRQKGCLGSIVLVYTLFLAAGWVALFLLMPVQDGALKPLVLSSLAGLIGLFFLLSLQLLGGGLRTSISFSDDERMVFLEKNGKHLFGVPYARTAAVFFAEELRRFRAVRGGSTTASGYNASVPVCNVYLWLKDGSRFWLASLARDEASTQAAAVAERIGVPFLDLSTEKQASMPTRGNGSVRVEESDSVGCGQVRESHHGDTLLLSVKKPLAFLGLAFGVSFLLFWFGFLASAHVYAKSAMGTRDMLLVDIAAVVVSVVMLPLLAYYGRKTTLAVSSGGLKIRRVFAGLIPHTGAIIPRDSIRCFRLNRVPETEAVQLLAVLEDGCGDLGSRFGRLAQQRAYNPSGPENEILLLEAPVAAQAAAFSALVCVRKKLEGVLSVSEGSKRCE